MRKGIKKSVIVLLVLVLQLPTLGLEVIDLQGVQKETLDIDKQSPKTLSGSLLIQDNTKIDELILLQREKDLADIERLWQGTVENNKVIEFALKKLATPESQRRIHSSLMAKTLSAVVSGASFIPYLAGADFATQASAFSAGRLAQSLINKKNVPTEVPLTDTELIELASLVERLQDTIIGAYYNYKNSLIQLKDARQRMILYNKNYTNALSSNESLDVAISSSLYDKMQIQEFQAEQEAKKYYLELQRMAGKTAMNELNLYQFDFNSALFKEGINQ